MFQDGNSQSTHIYPLKVTIGNSWCDNSIIGVNNGNNVHSQKFMKGAVQVTTLLLIVKIQIGDQNLQEKKEINHYNLSIAFFATSKCFIL